MLNGHAGKFAEEYMLGYKNMHKVFISRPNWLPWWMERALDDFYPTLEKIGFSPQTIGKEVVPLATPLEEVIDLLKICKATIVLGIPCIRSAEGSVKGITHESTKWFATEWNQIEASLSLALKKPTLIFRNSGDGAEISGGVFDRGACPAFIHDVNFRDKNWVQKSEGALKSLLTKIKI